MERLFDNIKDGVLNFKLNLCCFIFSVRVGILLFGSYNLITSAVALIAVMTGSFPPLYMHAQQIIMDGEYVPSSGAFAYCAEICTNVLLLCGVLRKDTVLLRYFTYVGLAMAAGTVLVYAMVIDVLDLLSTIILIVSLTCQIYVILLVRSYIVELQTAEINGYQAKQRWRVNVIEAIDYGAEEKYTVVIEPDILTEPEDLSIREVIEIIELNEGNDGVDEEKDDIVEVAETKDRTVEPLTVEASTSKEPTVNTNIPLRYPFKFVAIKVPKEKPIEEEGTDETTEEAKKDDNDNVTEKDTSNDINKADSAEVAKDAKKPPKLPIRTIWKEKEKKR